MVISRASPFSSCDFKFLHPGRECSGLYAKGSPLPIGTINLALRLPESFENIFHLAPLHFLLILMRRVTAKFPRAKINTL